MTVLVTGVGAIGTQVAAKLVEIGEEPILYDLNPRRDFMASLLDLNKVKIVVGDVNDLPFLIETFKNGKVDRVIHLASYLTRGLRERPYPGVKLNILGGATVLEAARIAGVKKVVFASSGTIYYMAQPPTNTDTVDEDFNMKVLSNRPTSIYELGKLASEHLGLIYNDLYGIDFVALRIAGGFGPSPGIPSGSTGGVLWGLVRSLALGKPVIIEDPSLTFSGRKDFIYFKDDANAFVLACFKEGLQKKIYHVRMEKTYDYFEVIDIFRKIFPRVPIEMKTAISKAGVSGIRPGKTFFGDIYSARTELGWKPQYDMETAIREWAEWIRNNEGLSSGASS